MTDIYGTISTRRGTPQREQARNDQVKNNAGGYVFKIEDEAYVRRFLILGTSKPTYYAKAKDLTKDAAEAVIHMAETNGPRLVEVIKEISLAGRAPKQNPTLFALAIACSIGNGKAEAYKALPEVARTASMLFTFVKYVEQFRGWGRGLKRAVGDWYLTKDADTLAYQAVKYRQRDGWTHRDVLRLAKPKVTDPALSDVVRWVVGKPTESLPPIISAFQIVQRMEGDVVPEQVIREFNLPWEALPDHMLKNPDVWRALIPKMGMTALIRNLSRFARLFSSTDPIYSTIVARLKDGEQIQRARIHPVNVLIAMRTYAAGRGIDGRSTWTPNVRVVDALDEAFYISFGNIVPANKRTMIGMDVSGSMNSEMLPGLSAREASMAMAMAMVASEPDVGVFAFSDRNGRASWGRRDSTYLQGVPVSKRQRLDDVVRMSRELSVGFGATDCSLPMQYATEKHMAVDTFIIFTDNETWHGNIHPYQALRKYRESSGIDAKLIVVAMTATDFSIADPRDKGMLDCVGFDSALPTLVADFSAGR